MSSCCSGCETDFFSIDTVLTSTDIYQGRALAGLGGESVLLSCAAVCKELPTCATPEPRPGTRHNTSKRVHHVLVLL